MFKKYDNENRDNYTFVKADICYKDAITKIFAENDIDRVVHFAAELYVDRSTIQRCINKRKYA